MNCCSGGALGKSPGDLLGRLKGVLGRLEAILGVLHRSFGDSEPSWTVLGTSWGPLGALWGARKAAPRSKTISEGDLPGPCRGTFRPGTRARTRIYC